MIEKFGGFRPTEIGIGPEGLEKESEPITGFEAFRQTLGGNAGDLDAFLAGSFGKDKSPFPTEAISYLPEDALSRLREAFKFPLGDERKARIATVKTEFSAAVDQYWEENA